MIQLITSLLKSMRGDYGNDLGSYITRRNPQSHGDVERFTRDYHKHLSFNRY
jgi:hypothetical protein